MPSLIVSSRYTSDSQLLRQAAQRLGWETLRLDGQRIPDWFDPPDDQIAFFHTAPHAFDLAGQLSRTLLGCSPDWTVRLPLEFLRRELRQVRLEEALALPGEAFIKHSVSKAFPAAVYDASGLAAAAAKVPPTALVHVGEPVEWSVEYRCFVVDREVVASSPYRRHGEPLQGHADLMNVPPAEVEAAQDFASSVLQSTAVSCPPATVLDVGVIQGRGWAVVECNECWASGIYGCPPQHVLPALLRACVPTDKMSVDERGWDFSQHYSAGCGS